MNRQQPFLPVRWLILVGCVVVIVAAGVAGSDALAAPPQLVELLRFTGTTVGDDDTSEAYPPDTMGALGGFGHYAELLNSSYALYSADTGNLSVFIPRMTLKEFWNNAFTNTHNDNPFGGPPPPLNEADDPFDPRIYYDSNHGRWYAVAVDHRKSTQSQIYVAVTKGDNPSPPAWRGFVIDADQNDTRWADFPTLGASKDGVFIAATMVPIDPMNTDRQVHLTGIPLASLKMATPTISGMRKVEDVGFTGALQMAVDTRPTQPDSIPYRGYVADNVGAVSSVEVPADFFSGGALVTSAAGFGGAAPQATLPYHPFQGSLVPIEAEGSARFTSNVVLASSGYWGVRSVAGTNSNQLQWFRANPATGSVIEAGTIAAPNGDVHFLYPSIHVSAFEEVVIGFNGMDNANVTGMAVNAPGSWAVAGATDINGVTTFGTPQPFQASASTYDVSFLTDPDKDPDPMTNPYRNRWGDYSATTLGRHLTEFATIQEYAPDEDVWATTVSQFRVQSDNDFYIGPPPGNYGSPSLGFGKSSDFDDTFSLNNMRFMGMFDSSNMPDELTGDGEMKIEQYDLLMTAQLQIDDEIFVLDDVLVLAQQKFTLVQSDESMTEFQTELLQFDFELIGLLDLPYDFRMSLDFDRPSVGYLGLIETAAGVLAKSYFDLYTILEIDRDRDGTFEEALQAVMGSHQILRAVPEPATATLLLLGIWPLLLWRRRRC